MDVSGWIPLVVYGLYELAVSVKCVECVYMLGFTID